MTKNYNSQNFSFCVLRVTVCVTRYDLRLFRRSYGVGSLKKRFHFRPFIFE